MPPVNRYAQKGEPRGPVNKLVVAWLTLHGPASATQVRQGLLDGGALPVLMIEHNKHHWAEDALYELYCAGCLSRTQQADGAVIYRIAQAQAPAPQSEGAPGPDQAMRIAAPRRIDVMHGPLLAPGNDLPARAGAMDYAAIPSLMSGRRVPLRAGARAP
jgi:hypothetical protein